MSKDTESLFTANWFK